MGSPPRCPSPALDGRHPAAGAARKDGEALSLVDPFLVEALENPRHRLTVLWMELDIQRFMQNHDQHQFEFQHLPSSYHRCAAHRVAQHYGLQTLVLDNLLDGIGRIAVRKTPDSRFPAVCLSDIPAKQPENEKPELVKIVIHTRPNRTSLNDGMETGIKPTTLRTVEEREEEYDKARARIFSDSSSPEVGVSSDGAADGGNICSSRQETEGNRKIMVTEKIGMKDCSSRVAIFKDREKDLNDPDYDRSYDRYSGVLMSNQNFNLGLHNTFQPFCRQYDPGFSQLRQMPWTQASVGCKSYNTIMNPCYTAASNQTPRDSIYVQWPSPAMMYLHSYEHFRNAVLQAPFYQQPLSFEHYQNH